MRILFLLNSQPGPPTLFVAFCGFCRGKTTQVLSARWAKFEAAIAAVKIRGVRPSNEDRRTIEAIIWWLANGAKWRPIPAYPRFRRWLGRAPVVTKSAGVDGPEARSRLQRVPSRVP